MTYVRIYSSTLWQASNVNEVVADVPVRDDLPWLKQTVTVGWTGQVFRPRTDGRFDYEEHRARTEAEVKTWQKQRLLELNGG